MNWDEVEGKWEQLKGAARNQWGKLTNDDMDQIRGNRERLIGRLQEAYGVEREAAEKEAEAWRKALNL